MIKRLMMVMMLAHICASTGLGAEPAISVAARQIKGTTHVHCTTQAQLDVILKRGIEFLTLSNYYPSAPWWPLAKMTKNYYRLHHDFPVMVNGKRTDGPFDWNKIVAQWINDLPPRLREEFPFREGGKI